MVYRHKDKSQQPRGTNCDATGALKYSWEAFLRTRKSTPLPENREPPQQESSGMGLRRLSYSVCTGFSSLRKYLKSEAGMQRIVKLACQRVVCITVLASFAPLAQAQGRT